jgi:CRP/FNR family transcriptional regulator, cyclic AMP receptor protein
MLEPAKTLEIFQGTNEPRLYAPGDVIFSEGETGEYIFGILDGEVELYVNGKAVETLLKGDVFGEGALVDLEQKRASTAIAKTECTLAYLDKPHFLFVVQETPEFAIGVLRSYSNRLRSLKHKI